MLDRERLDKIGEELKGDAARWWGVNGPKFEGFADDEFELLMRSFGGGGYTARVLLYRGLTDDELLAAQRRTTEELGELARRRVEIIESLKDLGKDAARAVGRAALDL